MRSLVLACLILMTLNGFCLTGSAQNKKNGNLNPSSNLELSEFKPRWNVGDQWIIETETGTLQERISPQNLQPSAPVLWRFQVSKLEQIAGSPAYRIEITGDEKEGGKKPKTTFWVNQQQGTIRQIQTQIPVQGSFRTITESYMTDSDQPTPVMSPLSALPLDLPVFQQKSKSSGSFQYQSISGPAGTKAAGEIGFMHSVEQQSSLVSTAELTKDLGATYVKSLEEKPIVQINLKGNFIQVKQIWQKSVPWPVFSDNGITKSRLVKFTPAKK